jgi:hypothetical protein
MLRPLPSRAGRAALALAVVALSACGDHLNPAETSPDLRSQYLRPAGGGGTESMPSISLLTLSSTTLSINGASVSYTATVTDPNAFFSGLSVQGSIIQGTNQRAVGTVVVPCGAGSNACTFSRTFIAPATLVPGAATFRLQLVNEFGVVSSTRNIPVTLVFTPTIVGVNVSSLHMLLDGPATPYTVTLQNPGPSLSGVSIQSFLNQDGTLVLPPTTGARRAAGAGPVQCGSGSGILPTGTCTVSMALAASNSNAGTGTLVPGLTGVELDLTVNGVVVGTGPSLHVHIDSAVTPVVTVSSSLSSTAPTDIILEGPSVPYSITLQNTGSARSGISIRTFVTQKTASRDAGTTLVSCGSGLGVMPNGTCTFSFQMTASNTSAGSGTLLAGASASLVLTVVDANGVALTQSPLVAPLSLLQSEGPPPPPDASRAPAEGLKRSRIKP